MRSTIALVSALTLAACNSAEAQRGEAAQASGSNGQRHFQVGAFDSLSLGGHNNVIVAVGGPPSVRAQGDERELADLEIRTRGSALHIGTKERSGWNGRRQPLTIYVTVPALAKAAIGGSGDIRIDNIQGASFEGAIGGSGNIEIASLRVEEGRFSVAGSGNIHAAAGQAHRTDIDIAGSGNVDLRTVQSRESDIDVVGSGNVRVLASQSANVTIMGSGDVTVIGQARCQVSKRGSGEVHCQS